MCKKSPFTEKKSEFLPKPKWTQNPYFIYSSAARKVSGFICLPPVVSGRIDGCRVEEKEEEYCVFGWKVAT